MIYKHLTTDKPFILNVQGIVKEKSFSMDLYAIYFICNDSFNHTYINL